MYLKSHYWANEMAQWVKAFAAIPENLSLIPGTHMAETENQLMQAVL